MATNLPPPKAPPPAYVYNPDDEEDGATFNAHRYVLAPNAVTEIESRWKEFPPSVIADHIVGQLGQYGVRRVSGPEDLDGIADAERQYLVGTLAWATDVLIAHEKKNAPRRDAGAPLLPDTEDVRKARAWLAAKNDALVKAGLVG